jgi:type I restriction enzyme, S subunit
MESELCALAPSDWRVRSIEDVCLRVSSGGTPSRSNASYYTDGTWPWVKTQELQDRWIEDTEEHITDEAVASSSAKVLPSGTVLVAMYGATVGQLGLLRRPMTCNQACSALVVDPAAADGRFLYFQLLQARSQLKGLATGAAQQNLSGALIKSLLFPFPSLSEQRAIAHILGTLDDKIELSRRMSETLEAMARALFKSWFVDFDPVRAKSEGRDTGLPKHLADLFPDRLMDSELGEVPEGWALGTVSDVIEHLREQDNPLAEPAQLFQHFSLPAFDEGQAPKTEFGQGIKSLKLKVPPGVVLLSKLNPEIERVWLVDVQPGDRAVCSTEFLVLRPRHHFSRSYVYCLARAPLFRQQIEGLVTGTSKSHQRAQVESILGLLAVVPPPPVVAAFDRMAAAALERALDCRREAETLAALRDALLPRLVSGELKVGNADRFVAVPSNG